MSKREVNQTSLTRSADALSAFAHHTPGGVAADFIGLENVEAVVDGMARYIPPSEAVQHNAEESTVPPVAIEQDEAPAFGQETPMEICRWCGLMLHFGRGPLVMTFCNPCKIEFSIEVPSNG